MERWKWSDIHTLGEHDRFVKVTNLWKRAYALEESRGWGRRASGAYDTQKWLAEADMGKVKQHQLDILDERLVDDLLWEL